MVVLEEDLAGMVVQEEDLEGMVVLVVVINSI